MSEDFKAEWIDDVTGDLSKTAFGEISATDANNKVFFVASADNKTNTDGTENRSLWYKVKVTRSGNGYKVEYGKVEDTTPKPSKSRKTRFTASSDSRSKPANRCSSPPRANGTSCGPTPPLRP